jgi:acyl transferase domain-containing protein
MSSPADQDRFFAPLLEGRRRAAQAISRSQVVAAFDARRLTALIDAMMRAFATERFATRAAARRAFEAELVEIIEPLRDALQHLRQLAEETSVAEGVVVPDDSWAHWLAQLRIVFQVADATWPLLGDALASASPVPSASGRRRFPTHGDGR